MVFLYCIFSRIFSLVKKYDKCLLKWLSVKKKKLKSLVLQDFFQAMLQSSIISWSENLISLVWSFLQLMNPSFQAFQACKMSASIALILNQKW